jgi:hypothetical protein
LSPEGFDTDPDADPDPEMASLRPSGLLSVISLFFLRRKPTVT